MLIGEVVALAITLQEHADPDAILCSDATARLLQDVASVEPHAPITHPEHSQPVLTYTLRAQRQGPAPRHWAP
jgi:class 3 adenylate cyclase